MPHFPYNTSPHPVLYSTAPPLLYPGEQDTPVFPAVFHRFPHADVPIPRHVRKTESDPPQTCRFAAPAGPTLLYLPRGGRSRFSCPSGKGKTTARRMMPAPQPPSNPARGRPGDETTGGGSDGDPLDDRPRDPPFASIVERRGLRLTVADERLDDLERHALIEQIRHHQDAEGMRPQIARQPRRPQPAFQLAARRVRGEPPARGRSDAAPATP